MQIATHSTLPQNSSTAGWEESLARAHRATGLGAWCGGVRCEHAESEAREEVGLRKGLRTKMDVS